MSLKIIPIKNIERIDISWNIIKINVKKRPENEKINRLVSDLSRLKPINKYNKIEQKLELSIIDKSLKI